MKRDRRIKNYFKNAKSKIIRYINEIFPNVFEEHTPYSYSKNIMNKQLEFNNFEKCKMEIEIQKLRNKTLF